MRCPPLFVATPLLLALTIACSSSSGEEAASNGTDSTGTATDTGGPACELPQSAMATETAMITIRNDRATQIYVLPYSPFS